MYSIIQWVAPGRVPAGESLTSPLIPFGRHCAACGGTGEGYPPTQLRPSPGPRGPQPPALAAPSPRLCAILPQGNQ